MKTHSKKLSVADKFDTPQKKTLKNKNFMRTITFKRNKNNYWAGCLGPKQNVLSLHNRVIL